MATPSLLSIVNAARLAAVGFVGFSCGPETASGDEGPDDATIEHVARKFCEVGRECSLEQGMPITDAEFEKCIDMWIGTIRYESSSSCEQAAVDYMSCLNGVACADYQMEIDPDPQSGPYCGHVFSTECLGRCDCAASS